ncbi:MAG: HAD family hydrolase [Planctomycetaceae bacterium]
MPLRTCLFDLGNVLINFSHDRMRRQMGAVCGTTPERIQALLFDSGLQWEFERGRLSEAEVHARLTAALGRAIDIGALAHAAADIFEPNPQIPGLLRQLKGQGLRLVVLSNTSATHFRHLRRQYDLLNAFDAFVLSYEVGAIKPDPAIFTAALQAIDCPPGECFYTDDIAEYVDAGRRHGLQAEVFTSPRNLVEHLRARGVSLPD